jgi:DNA-binding response OmpR family regulator
MPTTETRGHLLVVEDDPAVARVISMILTRDGFSVVTATSGSDAMQLLDERFDAMVLDLRLPGMRGDAFYYAATARQPWLTARALFLSGDIDETAEQVIAETGCRGMQKPFEIPRFLEAMRAMAPVRRATPLPRVG